MHKNMLDISPAFAGFQSWLLSNFATTGDMEMEGENRIMLFLSFLCCIK